MTNFFFIMNINLINKINNYIKIIIDYLIYLYLLLWYKYYIWLYNFICPDFKTIQFRMKIQLCYCFISFIIFILLRFPELSMDLLLNMCYNYQNLTLQDNDNTVNMYPNPGNNYGHGPSGFGRNYYDSGNSGPPNPNQVPHPISVWLGQESSDRNRSYNLDNQGPSNPNNKPDPLPAYETLGVESHSRGTPYTRLELVRGTANSVKFIYYDYRLKIEISPERLHTVKPVYNPELSVRAYDEHGIIYTYDCRSSDPSGYYCRVTYPDNTTCDIYDKSRLVEHIKLHKRNKVFTELCNPGINFAEAYRNAFKKDR